MAAIGARRLAHPRRRVLGLLGAGVAALTLGYVGKTAIEDRLTGGAQGAFQRGLTAFRAGQYDRAATDFGRAAAGEPQSVDALVLQGMALARLGRQAEAVDAFTKALALAPDRAVVYLYRAEALVGLGERERAKQDFEQAERLANGDERVVAAVRFQLDQLRTSPAAPKP